MGKKYLPPRQAMLNAKKALECKKQGSKAMTRTGWYRATQLAKGKPVSANIVKRMYLFKRHKQNAKIDNSLKNKCMDKGYVAWLGWGGTPGINWAEKVYKTKIQNKK